MGHCSGVGGWVAMGCACLAAVAQAQAPALSIDDAIGLALSRNERAKIADFQIDVADAAVLKAKAGFLPTLVANANGSLRPHPVNQPDKTGTATVTLTQPLVNASAWPLYFQAVHAYEAQRATSDDEKRLLGFDAANAFLLALSAERVLEAARGRVDTAKANVVDTQARATAGLNSSNDVTRAEVDLAASEQEVANDVGLLDRARLELALVLNSPLPPSLEPPAQTLANAARAYKDAAGLVQLAVKARPDVLAAQESVRAAQLFASEPLLRLVPALNLSGALAGNSNPTGNSPWHDQTLGATLSWTLYDASQRYADRRSRDAQAEITQLQLDALLRGVDNDVRVSMATLASAQDAFTVAGRGVEAARRNVDETATLYRQGLARAIELTDATDSRFLAEVAFVSAQYSMAGAYLGLRQAVGLSPTGKELP